MSRKSIGISAERELIHLCWSSGWAAIRVAGSGSIKYPVPDIVAGKGSRVFAVECKKCGSSSVYVSVEEIDDLVAFARLFGAEPVVAGRFCRGEGGGLPLSE